MITFYEGLPRSGKSYSAVKNLIVPSLKNGRRVVAYVEGLDFDKIASLAEISIEECRSLLVQLSRDDVLKIYDFAGHDALVVLDEVQNFWPTGRAALSPEITKFITEHGHRGLDILLMGQSIKDIHPLWRRRVERKHYFLKRTAIGKPNSYSESFFTSIPKGDDVVFQKVMTKNYPYDSLYFGAYKSHTDETTNKETLVEERAVIWNSPIFRRWLPLAGVVACVCVWYVWDFFHGGFEKSLPSSKNASVVVKSVSPTVQPASLVSSVSSPAAPASAASSSVLNGPLPPHPIDLLQSLTLSYSIRLGGVVRQLTGRVAGWVEWRGASGELIRSLTFRQIEGLGYSLWVDTSGASAVLARGDYRLLIMQWAVDKREAAVSETQNRKISGADSLSAASSSPASNLSPSAAL